MLGYADDAKYYKLMDNATRICFIERRVQFNEDPLHDIQLAEEEGINTQSIPFSYDDVSTNVSDSESKDEEQEEQDLDIENEDQAHLDPDPAPAPNPRTKWDTKPIESTGNNIGDTSDRRGTISQF